MTRILVTSALPYINGVKHLGTLAGSMLSADVFARFKRAQGHETLFICATDEHGTPTELAALEAGKDVRSFCDEQHLIQKKACEAFDLASIIFGRSSSPQNHELTQHFARQLWKNGFLDVRTTKQVYSNADKRFLPDRYVIGTCPHCGYDRARGDQCENCTRVLDPVDLINPRSAVSGSTDIEIRDSSAPVPQAIAIRAATARVDRWSQIRLAAARHFHRQQMAGRGAARSRHHARCRMGRAGAGRHRGRPAQGQSVLRLVRCAHRIYRRDQGMG